MNTLTNDNPQLGPYWRGACLGALTTALAFLAAEKLYSEPSTYFQGAIPEDIITSYNAGLKDALRTNPPSLELEQTCVNMWADKQPIRD